MSSSIKKYVGVYFEKSNDKAVVPSSWVKTRKNGSHKSAWPSHGDPVALAKQLEPPEDSWSFYSCHIITSANSYKKCYRLLDGFDTDSDMSSVEWSDAGGQQSSRSTVDASSSSDAPQARCCCQDLTAALSAKVSKVAANMQVKMDMIEEKLDLALEDLRGLAAKLSKEDLIAGPPANNDDELSALISSNHFVMSLAALETPSLQDTLRRMLQRMMTRTLAQTYSFTGLGLNRQPTKNKFSSHKAYQLLLSALRWTRFRDVSLTDIEKRTALLLRQAVDWSGSTRKRKRNSAVGCSAGTSVGAPCEQAFVVEQEYCAAGCSASTFVGAPSEQVFVVEHECPNREEQCSVLGGALETSFSL